MPKVSDLTELTAGNVALADEVYIVDGGASSKKASVETLLGTAALLTAFTVGGVKLVDNSGTDATHILAVKNTSDAAKGVVASSFIDAASNVLMNSDGLSIAEDARLRFSSTTAATGTPVSTIYASSAGSTTMSVYSLAKASATASHAFQFIGFLNGAAYEGMRIYRNAGVGSLAAWVIDVISDGSTYDGRGSKVKITTNDDRTSPITSGGGYPVLDLSNFGNRNRAITAGPAADPAAATIMIGAVPASLTDWGSGPDTYFSILDSSGNPIYIPAFSGRPTT